MTGAHAVPDPTGAYEGPYTRDYGHRYTGAPEGGRALLKDTVAELGPGITPPLQLA